MNDRMPKFDKENHRKDDQRSSGIRKALNRLEESGMSEVDILLQDIARDNVDIYDIYANPKTNIEKFVSNQIHDKVEQLTIDQGYHPKDDIEKMLQIIYDDLQKDYGVDEGLDGRIAGTVAGGALGGPVGGVIGGAIGDELTDETVGGGNWLEETTALTGQYGHSGKMEPVEGADEDMMARIKFLAGIRENDTPVENPADSNLTAMKSISSIFLR